MAVSRKITHNVKKAQIITNRFLELVLNSNSLCSHLWDVLEWGIHIMSRWTKTSE